MLSIIQLRESVMQGAEAGIIAYNTKTFEYSAPINTGYLPLKNNSQFSPYQIDLYVARNHYSLKYQQWTT